MKLNVIMYHENSYAIKSLNKSSHIGTTQFLLHFRAADKWKKKQFLDINNNY